MKKIKFELKDKIIYEASAIEDFLRVFHEFIGLDINEEMEVVNALKAIDLTSYYCESGNKITKKIKTLLNSCLQNKKEKIESNWSKICNAIRNLYWSSVNITASWGYKKLLGEGVWEGRSTCFSGSGCNSTSKNFVVINKRFRVLVLETFENGNFVGGGRCIVYFAGNREVYMTNFYFDKIPENKLLFFEALRRLLNLNHITYKKFNLPLPMYLNGDGYIIKTKKIIPVENRYTNQKLKCPRCQKTVLASEMKTYLFENTVRIGCSDKCLRIACHHCKEIIYTGIYYDDRNNPYCSDCFHNLYYEEEYEEEVAQ